MTNTDKTLQETAEDLYQTYEGPEGTVVVNDGFVLCRIVAPETSVILPEEYTTAAYLKILARGKEINSKILPGQNLLIYRRPQAEMQRLSVYVTEDLILIDKRLVAGSMDPQPVQDRN